ncbi:MAG TPA: IS3 family transposase [Micromonosporaceae bacterium]|nr:IS3 family transposase [Micromonosporaceae bacterium]
MTAPAGGSGAGGTRSEISGHAGNVVQGRDILGGIHFHHPPAVTPPAAVPSQLPWDMRGFVGRAEALERLDAILAQHAGTPGAGALVVVTGTAGVGKTCLVVHWAHRVRGMFGDGQLYVNLRGYDPGSPLAPAEALARAGVRCSHKRTHRLMRAAGLRSVHPKPYKCTRYLADLTPAWSTCCAATSPPPHPIVPGSAT